MNFIFDFAAVAMIRLMTNSVFYRIYSSERRFFLLQRINDTENRIKIIFL